MAATTQPATRPARLSIPDTSARQTMEKIVHELYPKLYADRSLAGHRRLAGVLLEQADRTGEDSVARYVLLRESLRLAGEGGDAAMAMQAISRMERSYLVDPWQLKESALRQVIGVVDQSVLAQRAADIAMELADQAFLEGQRDRVSPLLQMARTAANQSGQFQLVLRVRDRQKELALLQHEWTEYLAAEARLEAGKNDPADLLLCGKMRCFILDQWDRGLPLLAAGADETLRELAGRELRAGTDDALASLAVANAWWDHTARVERLMRRQVMRHAARWYRHARAGVSGVDLQIVEKRLAQAPLTLDEISRLVPGLWAEIFAGQQFEHKLIDRIDAEVNFNWGMERIGPTLPKDDFSIRWRGYLIVPREGTYTFVLLANRGGRLVLDGQPIIEDANLSRKRNGGRAEVKLDAGAHAIRLEYWDDGGAARAILQWITPGSSEPRVISSEIFKHEASRS